jgi:Flp pilus assembly pilin Flp
MRSSLFHKFHADERGAIAIIYALMLTILVAMVGGAVDYGRYMSARIHTLHAMDAAVLAAGRVLQIENGDEAKALAAAERYYAENKSRFLSNDSVVFSVENGEITVSISDSRVKTPFLGVVGIPELKVQNVSKAIIAAGGNAGSHVEIAMMLDVTGSMCGSWPWDCTSASKLDTMKEAAKDLINIVVWEDQSEFTSRIALIPFSEHVNVGSAYFSAITGAAPGGAGDDRTCVRERTTGDRYTGAAPNGANGYFKHVNQTSGTCKPTVTMMPLTSDKAALKAHVDSFTGKGSTAGHLGTQFAWYALDPAWGGIWGSASEGKPYSLTSEVNEQGKPKLYKIAVLMTDGEYNTQYDGSSSATQAREFCTNMKSQGIIVYTVGFEIGTSGSAYDTMQECASSADHFYNASNGEQLRMAFRDIAMQVSTLRLAE